jgi:hypothetical protein
MEEAPEDSKEFSHSARAKGMEWNEQTIFLEPEVCYSHYCTVPIHNIQGH